jgi:hypothetical protein
MGLTMTGTSVVLMAALVVAGAAFLAQNLFSKFAALPKATAPARGSAGAGVLYAFTKAFAPTAKESASLHLPSYLAGIGFHLGIFAALARLLVSLLPAAVPRAANITMTVVLGLGLACGLALLAKRALGGRLRGISVPDDFLANILVNATLAAGLAASLKPALTPVFQVTGAVSLLYAPLGKLRHMVFLFTSRRWSGAHFGRRGVRPTPQAPGARRG